MADNNQYKASSNSSNVNSSDSGSKRDKPREEVEQSSETNNASSNEKEKQTQNQNQNQNQHSRAPFDSDLKGIDSPGTEVVPTSKEYNPEELKEGYGRNEFAKTIGNKDYYKEEAERLANERRKAREEVARRYKTTQKEEESKEEQSSTESTPNPSSSTPTEPSNNDSSSSKIEDTNEKNDSSDDDKKEKNIKDKAKDKANVVKSDVAAAQNKINAAKAKAYQVRHPVESAKAEVKNKIKKKAVIFLIKYWWVVAIAAVVLLLFIILFVVFADMEMADNQSGGYIDPAYDFTETLVHVTNSYNTEDEKIIINDVSLDDFIKGAAYIELYNSLDGTIDSNALLEISKTHLILIKSLALSIGNYDSETKEITLKSSEDGIPYCDIYNGCNVYEQNGKYTYVSTSYENANFGNLVKTVEPLDSTYKSIMNDAYDETMYLLLTPKDVNEAIKKYDYGNIPYTQEIKDQIINYALDNNSYDKIISKISDYNNYKIYNLKDYAMFYNYASSTTYWWPIGSSKADENGLYSGKPSSTKINSKYGYRTHPVTGKPNVFHSGIDIGASCGSVIIASKSGTVKKTAYEANGCGYYIVLDHNDGTTTTYCHMLENSFKVKVNDNVVQGQIIGNVGTTGMSTGCHLHFMIKVNNKTVDPLEYVSAENPRTVAHVDYNYSSGNSKMQSVCLTLKNSGFSNNAVAAIMSNMKSESGFRPTALGDHGTSYGLCQWHNGRYSALKTYCNDRYQTVDCQLDYLTYELKNKYQGVYSILTSNNSAWDMTKYYCYYFEVPANRENGCKNRADSNSAVYLNYANNNCN